MTTNSKIKLNLDSLKSRREWKRHKVKDGHNIFRILPPFGEASNGYPYRKWQIIWGLTDPESGRARPFASSMTSEKRCPVTEYVAQLKKRADTIKAQMQTAGASEEVIKERLNGLNELINNLTPKTVYIYNAADKSGDVGLLELKSTAHKAMKTAMNQYIQDYNQDPTSLNSSDDDSGVWFDITRQGLGRDTEYDVVKCQTKVKNGNAISFIDDRSPLPDAVVENYVNVGYDLTSVYQVKSYDELQEILNANLEGITQLVPDADLGVEPTLATGQAPAPAARQVTKPTSKVTTRIDDNDDDDQGSQGGSPNNGSSTPAGTLRGNTTAAAAASQAATTKPVASSVINDDDFMAQADALLNG